MANNSFVPLLGLLAISAVALGITWRAMSHDARGMGGPVISGGIFPRTEKFLESPDRASLGVINKLRLVEASSSGMPGFLTAHSSEGYEIAPWEEVVILVEDHQALSAAVARGIAEILTGQWASPTVQHQFRRYPVILMVPPDGRPLALGANRLIRISSDEPEVQQPGQALNATIRLVLDDGRPRDWDGVPQLSPATAVNDVALVVDHLSQSTVAVDWAPWYAGLGRAIAEDILQEILPGGVLPIDSDVVPLQVVHGSAGWANPIPDPPQQSEAQWLASWQDPLIRGWLGQVVGTKSWSRSGTEVTTRDIMLKKFERGSWTTDGDLATDQHLLLRRDDPDLNRLVFISHPWGHRMAMMTVAEDAAQQHAGWLTAAAQGDSDARYLLRRHLLSADLPGQQQAQAVAYFRANPDLKSQALLGLREGASPEEQRIAVWVRWVQQGGDRPPGDVPFQTAAAWDGKPLGITLGDGIALCTSDGAYWQVDYRDSNGFQRSVQAHGEAASLNGVSLVYDGSTLVGD